MYGEMEMTRNIAVAELMTSLSSSPFRVDASASASARSGRTYSTPYILQVHLQT